MLASAFAFFLAGTAQADTGQGLQTLLGDGLAAFAAAGFPVYPLRAVLIPDVRGLPQRGFTFNSFQFCSLIKNIHNLLLKNSPHR